MRVLRTLVRMALFAVVGIAVLLGFLWLDHTRGTTDAHRPVRSRRHDVRLREQRHGRGAGSCRLALHPHSLVAIEDLVAGFAGDCELPTQFRHKR